MEVSELYELFLRQGRKLTTDSRAIRGGEIFVALRGETFDGNAFALKALDDGAAYCVVSQDSSAASSGDARILPFPDTLKTIQQLAAYHREHCLHEGRRIPVLGLTGTNGKTTTKELVRSVLAAKYRVLATDGNFNNNLGVPLTLLRLSPEDEIAIIEMGASHPGDIDELVAIAHPDYALITNVGRAHLLGFGSFEGVKKTKGEMYDYVSSKGKAVCFVNADSDDLLEMAVARKWDEMLHYGLKADKASVLPTSPLNPYLSLSIDGVKVQTALVGSYNAANVLAALAVGKYFGVDRADAIAAIEAYAPSNNRSQLTRTASNTVIVDAYNANPSSMACALDNFAAMEAPLKAAMLGDMLELGDESAAQHSQILARLAALKPDFIVLVGKEFADAYEKMRHCGAWQSDGHNEKGDETRCGAWQSDGHIVKGDEVRCGGWHCFGTSDEAAAFVGEHPLKGYAILLKGSRGTRMEKLLPVL